MTKLKLCKHTEFSWVPEKKCNGKYLFATQCYYAKPQEMIKWLIAKQNKNFKSK